MHLYRHADICKYVYIQIFKRLLCSYLSIYLCNFKQSCNIVMLCYHETHFIFHQSLWKWWSEIIHPILVNGLGFLFLLQQNERIAWQTLIHYNRCTTVILVRSCLIFVRIKKIFLSFDKSEMRKVSAFSFCSAKAQVLTEGKPDLQISYIFVNTAKFKNA